MFLTLLHTYRSDSVEKSVLLHAVWTLNRVDLSHREKRASLRQRIAYMWKGLYTRKISHKSSYSVIVRFRVKVLSHRERAMTQRYMLFLLRWSDAIELSRSLHTERAMMQRWCSDACFSWCDEATRLSFHTARDKTVISTISDLYMCVVKLEICAMRAIIVAMDLARVVTRQCEYIIKIYSVLIFPLVALLHRSIAPSLSVWKDFDCSFKYQFETWALLSQAFLEQYFTRTCSSMSQVRVWVASLNIGLILFDVW